MTNQQEKHAERSPFMRGRMTGAMARPTEKPINIATSVVRFAAYFKTESFRTVLMLALVCIAAAATVAAPLYQSRAIDAVVDHNFAEVPDLLLVMCLLFATAASAMYLRAFVSAGICRSVILRIRLDLFARISRLPVSRIESMPRGDLISRMTNDVDNISAIISNALASLCNSLLMLLMTAAAMLLMCWQLALISCSTVALTLLATSVISRYAKRYFSRRQVLLGQLNSCVEETVSNSQTVIACGTQRKTIEKFNNLSDEFTRNSIIAEAVGSSMGPLMNSIGNLSFLLVSVFGAWFALKGFITVGVIAAFIVYSKQFTRPISEIAQLYSQIQTALAGAERIFEIMDMPVEPDEGDVIEHSRKAEIEFRDVTFSYVPGTPVIRNFSLKVASGTKVALVGSTGSGKTTIINLLMRFYEPDSGEILINGISIKKLQVQALRKLIGIVLQDTVLFTDTVRNNLTYADETLTDDDIAEAVEFAGLGDFIRSLPEGMNTMLSGSGGHLSEGQKQLFAICRAFLSCPDILILDEATSNVDTRTEKHIQDAMARLMDIGTCLVVAHRLSTIRDADKIVVMSHGRIVEEGNHQELMAKGGQYSQLYAIQFEGQEI